MRAISKTIETPFGSEDKGMMAASTNLRYEWRLGHHRELIPYLLHFVWHFDEHWLVVINLATEA